MATLKGGTAYKEKLDEMRRKLTSAKTVTVGFMESATYPDGTSVPMVAAINEFGAPSRGQPPRPFFRRMIKAKSGEWPGALQKLLKASDYDAKTALEQLGAGIAGQLRQSITELVDPPLAPATVKRKGFDKPLIDTSHMLNSITHQVD
jgi:hypothetical protein